MTGQTFQLEHAVFTSVRSPMGSGYRIVATSGGITDDEKREITQRAPSHGNLCDESPNARAFACFALRTGRQCFLLSRHAGPEPSGRGGLKIYTDVLLMSADDYRADGNNPSRLLRAVENIVEDTPPAPPTQVPVLSVPRENPPRMGSRLSDDDMTAALTVLAMLLEGRTVIVTGAPDPATILCDVLCALPAGQRSCLACSYGLKVSKQRKLKLMFVTDSGGLGMAAHDPEVSVLDWNADHDPDASAFAAWIDHVRKAWCGERYARLNAIANELTDECSADALETVAFLESKIPTVALLNPAGLDTLSARVIGIHPTGPVQRQLYDHLTDLMQRRRNAFTPKETDADTSPAR